VSCRGCERACACVCVRARVCVRVRACAQAMEGSPYPDPHPSHSQCTAKLSLDRLQDSPSIDYRIVPGSIPNPVAELECVTLPWRLLQEV